MDLSSLAAPSHGASRDYASQAAAQAAAQAADSLRSVASAVRQFARVTWGLNSDLSQQAGLLRQSGSSGGGGSSPGGSGFLGSGVNLGQIGSLAKGFGSGLGALTGIDFGGPISLGMTALSLVSSLFGGKKPSVGPGGGAQFGLDAAGKARLGVTDADNGYAPSVNQAAADAVGAAAVKFFGKIGGKFSGTAVDGWGGYLGYDAGTKQYLGGDSQATAQQFKTAEEAAQAALVGVIKNAKIDGLSKDLEDRIRAVSTTGDLEGLMTYVAQLRQVYDAFSGWTAPLTAGETAIKSLTDNFAAAKDAAASLSQSVDGLQGSYEKQRAYLTKQFVDPLENRYLRATGANQAADLREFDAQAAIVRRDAAALGGEAVLQAERTLGVERAAILRKYQLQGLAAATQLAQQAQDVLQATYNGLAAELKQAQAAQIDALTRNRELWDDIAQGLQKARDSLLVGKLSPLDPGAQMQEAQRQFSDAVNRAKAGDATAASQLQSLAEQALAQTQSYYSSGKSYAAYFESVQQQLAQAQAAATAQARAADQQISLLRGTESNTRSIADITRDMTAILQRIADAQRNATAQAGGGGATGAAASDAISEAYRSALGREPDRAGATFWANQIATGTMSLDQVAAQIRNSDEARIYALYKELLGHGPDEAGSLYWRSQLASGASLDSVRAAIMNSAEYKKLKGYASGGDHLGGWRIVGERGPELEATGPARIWNFDQTQRLLGNDNASTAGAIEGLGAKLDALIRVAVAAGDDNAQGIAGLRDELAELRRRARLTEAA